MAGHAREPQNAAQGKAQADAEASQPTIVGIDVSDAGPGDRVPRECTEPPDEATFIVESNIADKSSSGTEIKATRGLAPGQTFGRYLLLRQLGEGGMGVVYEAYDPELDRKVALKLISIGEGSIEESTTSSTQVAQVRLILEAQAQAKFVHGNVVSVYDVGTSEYGIYMAMEMVSGTTVKAWLRHGPRTWREVLPIFLQAAAGLGAAHEAGLVHRDFKPDNLLLGDDGRVRVADFGLATGPRAGHEKKATGQLAQRFDTTQIEHGIAGTPSYMAPEQHRGTSINAACDQYAFCVSLYEAIYRAKPYRGHNRIELLRAIEERRLAPLPTAIRVPRWLRAVLLRGLSPRPEDRFTSMRELIAALEDGLSRRKMPWFVASLSLVGGLIGLGAVIEHRAQDEQLCQQRADRILDVWNFARWQAVESAFERTGLPFARDAASLMQHQITNRVNDWQALTLAACRDAKDAPERQASIVECLESQLAEQRALAGVYSEAGPSEVRNAVQTVSSLAQPDDCRKQQAIHDVRERPKDPRALAGYLELVRDIRALATTARLQREHRSALKEKRLVARAQEVAAPSLLAQLASIEAAEAANFLEPTKAQRASDHALLWATMAHDATVSSDVLQQQVFLRGYKLGSNLSTEGTADILRLAKAHLIRAGEDPVASAKLCVWSVPYLTLNGRGDAAESCLRGAIEAFERSLGPRHAETIRAIEYLAVTIGFRRADPEAEQLLLRVRKAYRELAGLSHPALAMTLYNLTSATLAVGDAVRAAAYFDEARSVLAAGATEPDLAIAIRLFAGDLARDRGYWVQASDDFRECMATAKASGSIQGTAPYWSCASALATIHALQGDRQECANIERAAHEISSVQVSGLFGENGRIWGMEQVRDLSLACGDFDQARAIDRRLYEAAQAYRAGLGGPGETALKESLALLEINHGSAAALQEMEQRLAKGPALNDVKGRCETLAMRQELARLYLENRRAASALTLLHEDLPIRLETQGTSIEATWRVDVLRAWALVEVGAPQEAVELVQDIPRALAKGDQETLYIAYLWAVLASAHEQLGAVERVIQLERERGQEAARLLPQLPESLKTRLRLD